MSVHRGLDELTRQLARLKEENAALKQEIAQYQQNEDRFQAIMSRMKEGYFEIDLKGDFTYFSPAAPVLFGYPPDELMGMNNREYTSPETAEKMFSIFSRVYETGNPAEITDYEVIGKDGSTHFLEISAYLITDKNGQPVGFRGLGRDVSDRKKSDRALKESEERFRKLYKESKRAQEIYQSLLNSSPDAIVIYDMEQKIKYVNPAFTRIFGWAPEEIEGKNPLYVPETHKAVFDEMIDNLIQNGRPVQGLETRRLTRSGELLDVSISASRYGDYKGNPAGVLLILHDITESKKLRMHLQQAQKMESVGTLAGGIAHDFNNLLMGIQGRLSLMMFDRPAGHPHYQHMQEIENYVKRAADLTRQLLGFARGGKYEVAPTDLNDLIASQSRMFCRTRKDITFHEKLATNLRTVEVDQRQIEHVLLNLYVNAGHAMPDGGELYIETRNEKMKTHHTLPHDAQPGDYVKISVTDTGIGMEESVRRRVFEPFFTTKEMGRGTGLGLASAYGIIKNHQGFITVYSEPGRGTTFNIYLPASTKMPQAEKTADEQIIAGIGTVLLVDDEEMIIEVGGEMLESLGYSIRTAPNGEKALEIYRAEQAGIDLIILDMIMPGMSGGETFDRIKEINPSAKILLASGYSINGQAAKIMERGCNGFIQKPFNMLELSHKMAEILAGED